MIKNYLVVAMRNIFRHKSYSFINISGLAVGMACCIFIILFIQHEFSYDRHHTKADRIYKVLRQKQRPDGEKYHMISTLGPVGPTMQQDFPEVALSTRFVNRPMVVAHNNIGYTEQVLVADREFLNVFDYAFLKGNKKDLQTPFTACISQQLSHKLFGDADPMGKVVSVHYKWVKGDFTIRGVLDHIPDTSISDFECELLITSQEATNVPWYNNISLQDRLWGNWYPNSTLHPMLTYVVLKPNASVSELSSKLPDFAMRYLGDEVGKTNAYVLAPLTQFYLYAKHEYANLQQPKGVKPLGDYRKSYTFGMIGLFVLVIACINFMNLATARSARRAREVGMRKVVGAYRTQIAHQFIGESVLMTFMALVLALLLTYLLLPIVNSHLGFHLQLEPSLLLCLIGFALVVGILAGSYPAFFLSSFHPKVVLSSTPMIKGGHAFIRKGLVVVQFAISIVLIVGTLVAFEQTEFMRHSDIGFSRDARLVVPFNRLQDRDIRARADNFKQRAIDHAGIQGATLSIFPPGWEGDINMTQVKTQGMDTPVDVHMQYADADFLDVYGIKLVSGRKLTPQDRPVWSEDKPPNAKILINETAARALGHVKPGDYVQFWDLSAEVVGIFQDFHNTPLHNPMGPLLIFSNSNFDYLTVHFNTQQLPAVMMHLETVWKDFLPGRPFEFQFLDDYLDEFYRTELKLRQLYMACTGLAIFIACLGLLGLISYTGEVRIREIGIRKVLGATEWGLVGLLTREFLVLVSIASVLAWPIAWFAMSSWLQNFAYRINMGFGVFIISTSAALLVTLLTIGYQALKAARTNPVDALRHQ